MELLVQSEDLIEAGSGGCGWRSAEGIVVPIEEVRIREGSKTLELKRLQIGANLLLQCCPFLLTGGGAGRRRRFVLFATRVLMPSSFCKRSFSLRASSQVHLVSMVACGAPVPCWAHRDPLHSNEARPMSKHRVAPDRGSVQERGIHLGLDARASLRTEKSHTEKKMLVSAPPPRLPCARLPG